MMAPQVGIDMVELSRVQAAMKKHRGFVKRVLSAAEYRVFTTFSHEVRQVEYVAGRWAAKEALSKALGTGIGKNLPMNAITVLNDEKNKPYLAAFPNDAKFTASISLTHTQTLAAATVTLVPKEGELAMVEGLHRNTHALVDLAAIRQNIKTFKQLQPNKQIYAVVKANAYGHGLVAVAKTAAKAGVSGFCVAIIDEGIALRKAGINQPIVVLGVNPASQAPVLAKYQLGVAVGSLEFLQAASHELKNAQQKLLVHFALDSGMGRLGFTDGAKVAQASQWVKNHADVMTLAGVFTHFATADSQDDTYFNHQVKTFKQLFDNVSPKPKLISIDNTAAGLWHPEVGGNVVRLGIGMYGLNPSGTELSLPRPLVPALSWHSELAFVKQITQPTGIGYGKTYTAKPGQWIGTVPCGYADGFMRCMQGFKVLVDGKPCPIVGRVCMDQFMVLLPEKMPTGTPVVMLGKQGQAKITAEDVAAWANTINYEIITSISSRVPRIYRHQDE